MNATDRYEVRNDLRTVTGRMGLRTTEDIYTVWDKQDKQQIGGEYRTKQEVRQFLLSLILAEDRTIRAGTEVAWMGRSGALGGVIQEITGSRAVVLITMAERRKDFSKIGDKVSVATDTLQLAR